MIIKMSKKEWIRIGHKAGWMTAMKQKQLCAWCGDFIADKQDGREPLDERLPDSHGLCLPCKDTFIKNYQREKGLSDKEIEALMQDVSNSMVM